MRKKIIVKAPVLSRSGYGEQSRFALRALRSRDDLFDIYLINIPWGHTGLITENDEERQWIDQTILKTGMANQDKTAYDMSLQITVPNEFEQMAPVNVGYTAGIETTKVAPEWIAKCNETVERLIVVSNHSKKVFEQTKYNVKDDQGNEHEGWGLHKPVCAVNYPVRKATPEPLEIEFETTNNFLVVSQWAIRKNIENTIKWFTDAFRDDPDAGLVLKTNTAADSITDRAFTEFRLKELLKSCGEYKCKIYFLHGTISPGNLTWLYKHPTMRALINIGHGEGFGLPLFEAAYTGLPLITVTWSGHMDFICKPNKKGKEVPKVIRVDYELKPVQPEAVWKGVINDDSMWAYAKEASFKRALKEAISKKAHWKKEAKLLQNHILENFTTKKMYNEFVEGVLGESIQTVNLEDLPKVSLITSVYDGDEFIRPFLEDITRQTIFEDKCELILINANSPGNEETIIQEYVEKYPDNIVYKKLDEDPGIYGVWTMGAQMASGEYLTNANLDDRKAADSLEKHAVELYLNPDVDLVYADMLITDVPNETFENNSSNNRQYNFPDYTFDNLKMVNMPHAAPMWRKEYHEKYGYFDSKYRSAGDWECWLRGAAQGSQFKKINRPLGLYYFNPVGISTNPENFSWKRKEEQEVYEKYESATVPE